MNLRYSIFFTIQILIISCYCHSDEHSDCEWMHSQIIGHYYLNEPNDGLPALYLGVRCSDNIFEYEYALTSSNGCTVLLKKDFVSLSEITLLMADIQSIEFLLQRDISDSTDYKLALDHLLENVKLVEIGNNKTIPKSSSYMVQHGYRMKRVIE